jgi:APA family basic amino acid/polyamine antiporter
MKLKLKRDLSLVEATLYGIGIIIGAGIYVLIGPAAGLAGNAVWISFLIGALIASFTGLSYAELSAMYPKAAAEFLYVKKAYGSKFWAFLIGWLLIFTGVVSAATVALGFSGCFIEILKLGKIFLIPVAIALILFLSFINFSGIKESSRLNIIFTSIEVFGILLIIFLGLPSLGDVKYFQMPFGFKGVLSAAAIIFFAYIGFEDIANIAEETKSPKKFIPLAIITAVIVTTILYIITSLIAVSLVDYRILREAPNALAVVASKTVLGENAYFLVSFITLFATTGTVLIILVVTSRMVYGMAREYSLPSRLGRIHRRTKTPWLAVIAIMLLSIVFVFFGKIEVVANITSLGAFVTFAAVNLSLIWLRYTKPHLERPFKVPLNIGKYPIISILGLAFCSFMIFQFDVELLLFGLGILVLGTIFYWLRRHKIIE